MTKIKTARRKTSLVQEQLLRLADGVFDADLSSESNLERLTAYYQVNTRRHLPYKFLPLTTTCELVDDKFFTEVLNAPDMFELINFHVCECVRQNIKMRRCKNCGKYFALTGHAGTDYCDRPFGLTVSHAEWSGHRKCGQRERKVMMCFQRTAVSTKNALRISLQANLHRNSSCSGQQRRGKRNSNAPRGSSPWKRISTG